MAAPAKEVMFVLGGPASGKRTQAVAMTNAYSICYLSTDNLLWAATTEGSPRAGDPVWQRRAEELRGIMKSGRPVPDEILLELVKSGIDGSRDEYVFVDGFPRNLAQVDLFEARIGPPKAVLFLDVPDDVLTARLLERAKASGRVDGNEESIAESLKTYHEESDPVIERYDAQDKVIRLPGNREMGAIRNDIVQKVTELWKVQPRPRPKPRTIWDDFPLSPRMTVLAVLVGAIIFFWLYDF